MRAKLLLLVLAMVLTMNGCRDNKNVDGKPVDSTTVKRDSIPMQ